MKWRAFLSIVLAVMLLRESPGRCAELGDTAPPLQVEKWINGGPADLTEGKGKTINVIVFWESWCDSCMASLPQLAELHEKLKDRGVRFIAISVEPADAIENYFRIPGTKDRMNYFVAADMARHKPPEARINRWQMAYGAGAKCIGNGYNHPSIPQTVNPPAFPKRSATEVVALRSGFCRSSGGPKNRKESWLHPGIHPRPRSVTPLLIAGCERFTKLVRDASRLLDWLRLPLADDRNAGNSFFIEDKEFTFRSGGVVTMPP